MKYKNILLLYKKSSYRIYFQNKKSTFKKKKKRLLQSEIKNFKASHDLHYETMDFVRATLKNYGIKFTEYYRGRKADYDKFDLIITVGGDGTFLEAARKVKNQTMLGINSAPGYSVGRYCAADKNSFEIKLKNIIAQKYKTRKLHRLNVSVTSTNESVNILNDALICHRNPAALFRCTITINGYTEEQKSSGLWVSTAAGSTGAMASAGGKIFGSHSTKFQYKPRELHLGLAGKRKLTGGVLDQKSKITIIAMNRQGCIYADGAHHKIPIHYGDKIKICNANKPINTIIL